MEKSLNTIGNKLLISGISLPVIKKNISQIKDSLEIESSKPSENISDLISDKLIKRSIIKVGAIGGLTSIPGIIPGIGSVVGLTVALTADIMHLVRTQIELCCSIAFAYDIETNEETLTAMALAIIGFSGNRDAFKNISASILREIIDQSVSRYLQIGIEKAATSLFNKLGIKISSRITKILPILGIPIGAAINIASTKNIGNYAKKYFSELKNSPCGSRKKQSN